MLPERLIEQIRDLFPADVQEFILSLVVSSIGFAPATGDDTGATRIGGTPDLPPEITWPMTSTDGADKLLEEYGTFHGSHLKTHLASPYPMPFVAQVDLKEVNSLGPISAELPSEGRLLFFYDLMVGPWQNGTGAAKVIWDLTPKDQLTRADIPPALKAMDQQARTVYAKEIAKYGMEVEQDYNPGYITKPRPMKPIEQWSLMNSSCVEFSIAQDAPLDMTYPDQDHWAGEVSLEDLLADFEAEDAFDGGNFKMLGMPDPEQDDPRYEPALKAYLKQYNASEDSIFRDAFFKYERASAVDWRLLLQIDVANWLETQGEGTVYFLIHDADLKNKNFDNVWAVYQQT